LTGFLWVILRRTGTILICHCCSPSCGAPQPN
jgi:hypothetical protein